MTNTQAQALAPSYCVLPEDGAAFHCNSCRTETPAKDMIKTFTPDGRQHLAMCRECVCHDWLASAKDCGVAGEP